MQTYVYKYAKSLLIILLIWSVPDRTYKYVGFVKSMEGEAELSFPYILQARHISMYGLELTK